MENLQKILVKLKNFISMHQTNILKKINVLGDSNVDMILNLSNKKKLKDPLLFCGGSAANVASGVSKLGLNVSFFGALGNDMFGKHVIEDMELDGIETKNIDLLDNYSTAMVIGVVEKNSQRHLFVWPPENGAHNKYVFTKKSHKKMLDCDWLHVSGINLRNSPTKESMLEAMKLCSEKKITVSFDLNLRIELWGLDDEFKDLVFKAMSYSNIIFGNLKEEIIPLFNNDESSLNKYINNNQVIVCRNGKKGALGITRNEQIKSDAVLIEPIDSVGAGDAFNSGFIYASCVGANIKESLETGNLVAAYKLLGSGARHLPTNEQLEEFKQKFTNNY